MNNYLVNQKIKESNLIFINAKGLGGEENYLKNIIRCFENINIKFKQIYEIDENTMQDSINNINWNNSIIFLMGGNPIVQYNEIKRLNLVDKIKNHNGIVIGFCAGAINLSRISIITSDEDFKIASSYQGIERVNIIIEPHYNLNEDARELEKRNNEIRNFAKQYSSEIIAIPDESIVIVEDNDITFYGNNYRFGVNQ